MSRITSNQNGSYIGKDTIDTADFSQSFNTGPNAQNAAEAIAAQVKTPAATEYVREIDLGDGRGKQVFKGNTPEELINSLVQAQEHATRKIAELSNAKKKVTPEKTAPWQTPVFEQPKALSTAEQLQLAELLNSNPEAGFDKLVELRFGTKPDVFLQTVAKVNELYAQEAANTAAVEFMADHESDYEPTMKNRSAIQNFLVEQNLPVTRTNLEYAFQELSGKLDMPATETPQVVQTPAQTPQVSSPTPPPTFLSDRSGQRTVPGPENGGLDANALNKLSLEDMRSRIDQHFRSGGR